MEEALAHLNGLLQPGDFTKKYDLGKQFARGAFSTIHKAEEIASGRQVVVKRVNTQEEDEIREVAREIEAFKEIKHDNIIRCYGAWMHQEKIHMVIEFCHVGSVASIYEETEMGFDEDFIKYLIREMLKGLEYMHSLGIIHRDVKCANTLMNEDGEIKLADLGTIGRTINQKRYSLVGTPHWMAPEICSNNVMPNQYNVAADIWALGITVIEAAEIDPPHPDDDPMEVMNLIALGGSPNFANPDARTRECLEFTAQCLITDPNKRPCAAELLKHRFMQNVDEDIGMMTALDVIERKQTKELEKKKKRGSRRNSDKKDTKKSAPSVADPPSLPPVEENSTPVLKRSSTKSIKPETIPEGEGEGLVRRGSSRGLMHTGTLPSPKINVDKKKRRKSVSVQPEKLVEPGLAGTETVRRKRRHRNSLQLAEPNSDSPAITPPDTPESGRVKSSTRPDKPAPGRMKMTVDMTKVKEQALIDQLAEKKYVPLPSSRKEGEVGSATARRGGVTGRQQKPPPTPIPPEARPYEKLFEVTKSYNPKPNEMIHLLQQIQKKQRKVTEKAEKPLLESIDSLKATFKKQQDAADTQFSESKSTADREFDKKSEEITKIFENEKKKIEGGWANKLKEIDEAEAAELAKVGPTDHKLQMEHKLKFIETRTKHETEYIVKLHEATEKFSSKMDSVKAPYMVKQFEARHKWAQAKAKREIEYKNDLFKAKKKLRTVTQDLMVQHLNEKHKVLEKTLLKNSQNLHKLLKDTFKEINQQLSDKNFEDLQELKNTCPDKKQYQTEYQEKLKAFKASQKAGEAWFTTYLSNLDEKLASDNKQRHDLECQVLNKNLQDLDATQEATFKSEIDVYTQRTDKEIDDMKKLVLLKQVEGAYQLDSHMVESQHSHSIKILDENFKMQTSIFECKTTYYKTLQTDESTQEIQKIEEEFGKIQMKYEADKVGLIKKHESILAELRFVKYPTMGDYNMGKKN